jgi:hypothetical protein
VKENYPFGFTFLSGIFILYGIFSLAACDTEPIEGETAEMGYAYFPLDLGNYRIFEVVDIQYTIQNEKDSSSYYVKEIVKDSSIDQSGAIAYDMYIYKRRDLSASWDEEPVRVYQVKKSSTNLVIYEENVPYVKLVFPVKSGLSWDGNAFNTYDPLYYIYSDEDLAERGMDLGTEQFIRVVQNDFDDQIVRKDIRYEIYAAGIGLVFIQKSILEYCQESDCFGEHKIHAGLEFRQTLIDYGKE